MGDDGSANAKGQLGQRCVVLAPLDTNRLGAASGRDPASAAAVRGAVGAVPHDSTIVRPQGRNIYLLIFQVPPPRSSPHPHPPPLPRSPSFPLHLVCIRGSGIIRKHVSCLSCCTRRLLGSSGLTPTSPLLWGRCSGGTDGVWPAFSTPAGRHEAWSTPLWRGRQGLRFLESFTAPDPRLKTSSRRPRSVLLSYNRARPLVSYTGHPPGATPDTLSFQLSRSTETAVRSIHVERGSQDPYPLYPTRVRYSEWRFQPPMP